VFFLDELLMAFLRERMRLQMVYHSMAKAYDITAIDNSPSESHDFSKGCVPPMVQLFLFWPKISGEDGAGEDAVSEIFRVLLYNRPILECRT
jgi:hypothetical protein